jgi:hypothetical protein
MQLSLTNEEGKERRATKTLTALTTEM